MFANKKINFSSSILIFILFYAQILFSSESSWITKAAHLFSGFSYEANIDQEEIDGVLSWLPFYSGTIDGSNNLKNCITNFTKAEVFALNNDQHIEIETILRKGQNGGVFRVSLEQEKSSPPQTLIMKLFDSQRAFLREVSTLYQIGNLHLEHFQIADIFGGAICEIDKEKVYMLAEEDLGAQTFKEVLSNSLMENINSFKSTMGPLMKLLGQGLAEFHYKGVENPRCPLNVDLQNALYFELSRFIGFAKDHDLDFDLEEFNEVARSLIEYAANNNISRGRMHFDLHFNNIIITEASDIGLIDFAGSYFSMGQSGIIIGIPGFDLTYFTEFHKTLHDFRIDYFKRDDLKWSEQSVVINALSDFYCSYNNECNTYFEHEELDDSMETLFYRLVQGLLLFVYKYDEEDMNAALNLITMSPEQQKNSSLLIYCISYLQNVVNEFQHI